MACASYPIFSAGDDVLGTFACYYREKRNPSVQGQEIIDKSINLASIAIQKKKDEDKLFKAKEQAEQANNAKSKFLSRMSHELRTPLNAIMGFSQLYELEDNLTATQKENARDIYNAGSHLLDLVNDMLDLSRIETGQLELHPNTIRITTIFDECMSLIAPFALKNGINLNIEALEDKTITIYTDPVRLKQILLNFLSNAIKYNNTQGRVTLGATRTDDQHTRISIQDTGPGLSREQQQQLFSPFNRLGAENSTIEGIGIGLVISQKLAEMMGGTIGIDSEPGKGSTFWIEL